MKDGTAEGHPGLTLLSLFPPPQFRLKRCGLGHRVYLVEQHGSVHNLSLPESTLLQAVTNTQVSWEGRAKLAGTPASVAWLGPGATSLCWVLFRRSSMASL